MKFTKLQRKTLLYFHSFSSASPTIGRQLAFNWFAWLSLLILAMIGCVVLLIPGYAAAGCLWLGIVVGAFFRDIGRYRGVVRVWPVYREIINWQRVSELIDSSERYDA
jgi:hypothetical protein